MNYRNRVRALALFAVTSLYGVAHAAIDTTDAVAGVTDAQSATTTVLGAMITMGAAIYGLRKIKRLLGG